MDDQPSNVKSNVNFYRKPGNQTASVMCNEEYQQQNQEGRPEIAPLHFSGSLAKTVLNSLSANIAILDEYGVILETNQAWRNYARDNEMDGADDSIGVNYLTLCDATIGKEAKCARDVAAGRSGLAIKGRPKAIKSALPWAVSFPRLLLYNHNSQ